MGRIYYVGAVKVELAADPRRLSLGPTSAGNLQLKATNPSLYPVDIDVQGLTTANVAVATAAILAPRPTVQVPGSVQVGKKFHDGNRIAKIGDWRPVNAGVTRILAVVVGLVNGMILAGPNPGAMPQEKVRVS